MDALRRTFSFASDCEIAIEIDPRTLTPEAVFALKDAGFTRASVGVQDFEPRVQRAVGRVQSFEQYSPNRRRATRALCKRAAQDAQAPRASAFCRRGVDLCQLNLG